MGTLRYEKEVSERQTQARQQAEIDRRRRELQAAQAANQARLAALQQEIENQQAELALLETEQSQKDLDRESRQAAISRKRGQNLDSTEADPARNSGA